MIINLEKNIIITMEKSIFTLKQQYLLGNTAMDLETLLSAWKHLYHCDIA